VVGAPVRPAFTVSAAAGRASLPVEAWAAATFGAGAAFAGVLRSGDCIDWCSPARLYPGMLSAAALFAAAAWFLLPLSAGPRATMAAAGALAIAAGVLSAAAFGARDLLFLADARALPLMSGVGLAAPALMLPAISPGAALELGGAPSKGPVQWLRMGALPALALFGGLGAGFALQGGEFLGAAGLLAAGALLLRAGAKAPRRTARPEPPPAGRAPQLFRMTPMLRLHALGEIAVAFVVASGATLATVIGSLRFDGSAAAAALVLGGLAGAAVYAIVAPTLDASWGRGRLLTLVLFSAAVAPLVLLSGPLGPSALGLFLGVLLLGFVLAASPQRSALAFDLSSSQGRLRLSGDLQGAKLLCAAAAPFAFSAFEGASPGMGPLAAALVAIVAFALFAPSLGALGAPRR